MRSNVVTRISWVARTSLTAWSRAPIPVKIAAAGGNSCDHAGQRVCLKRLNVSRFTGPAMPATSPENVNSTVMVGSSMLVHLSLTLGDGSKAWTWVLSTSRTASEDLQDVICSVRLSAAMVFFVRFLYFSKASAKMLSKFGEEVEVGGSSGSWGIV
jgi:hypothetical protein